MATLAVAWLTRSAALHLSGLDPGVVMIALVALFFFVHYFSIGWAWCSASSSSPPSSPPGPSFRERPPVQERPMTIEHEIALIPGDGIGREVLPAGVAVLEAVARRRGLRFSWNGSRARERTPAPGV